MAEALPGLRVDVVEGEHMSEPWPVGKWRSDGPNRDRFCRCPCSTCAWADGGYEPDTRCPDCPVHGRMSFAELRGDWLARTKGVDRPVLVTRGPDWLSPRGWRVLCKCKCKCSFSTWSPDHAEAVRWADAHARQHHSGWHLWDS